MGDSAITFESIFDLVRKERGNEVLQELNKETYQQIVSYLKTKIKQYEDSKALNVNASELEKIKTQIISARKLIKELYERRERKILLLATDRSRTAAPLQDEKHLLDEERSLFEGSVSLLDIYRKEILLKLVNAKMPFSSSEKQPVKEQVPEEKPKENFLVKEEISVPYSAPRTLEQINAKMPEEPQEDLALIRFTGFVPKFLGKKMELFGPYEPGDMANLDREIAGVLIKRGRAEEVKI